MLIFVENVSTVFLWTQPWTLKFMPRRADSRPFTHSVLYVLKIDVPTSHMYSVSVSTLMSSGRTSLPSYGPIQVPAGIRFLAHTPYPTQGILEVHKQTSSGNLRIEPFSKGLWDWPAFTSFLKECKGPCIGHSPSCFSLQISHPKKQIIMMMIFLVISTAAGS